MEEFIREIGVVDSYSMNMYVIISWFINILSLIALWLYWAKWAYHKHLGYYDCYDGNDILIVILISCILAPLCIILIYLLSVFTYYIIPNLVVVTLGIIGYSKNENDIINFFKEKFNKPVTNYSSDEKVKNKLLKL